MAEVKWIKIYVDMFDNKKIKFIRSLPEGNDILLCWIMLLASAGKCNSNGFILLTENVPYTVEMLANEYSLPLSTVQLAIQTLKKLNMVNDEDGAFFITSWEEYQNVEGMEKIREQTRLRVSRHRQKKLSNATGNVTVTDGNETDKELDIKNKKDINTSVNDFFETIWKLYPKKEGKGQVSKSQKENLYKIGLEEMARAIERYKLAKKDKDRQYLQNGSTFFNSGYVDYLDSNFAEEIKEEDTRIIVRSVDDVRRLGK